MVRVLGAILQECVIAHQIVFGDLSHWDVFGFVADTIAVQFLLVNLNAGQRTGFHFAFWTSVFGCFEVTHFTFAETGVDSVDKRPLLVIVHRNSH